MIHCPGFSMIRERVLAESGAVLQDDSGVPYHYYLTSNWRVQLYGQYSEPYGQLPLPRTARFEGGLRA